jgi:hypothetical protein
MRGNVDDEIAQSDHLRAFHLGRGNRSPQDRVHSQYQLSWAERLLHIVVGANLEPDHAIDLIGSGREHDDGKTNCLGASPQASAHFEARDVRQHDVQYEQVGLAPLDLGQCGVAIMGNRDVMTNSAKIEGDQLR